MVLVRMWRESDHPRACAVVHHICSMILAAPQASSQLKSVHLLAHVVLWPTVADALQNAGDLDPDELTAHPVHLISNDFASSSWQSLPFCTDSDNVLANLDAACGILGIGFETNVAMSFDRDGTSLGTKMESVRYANQEDFMNDLTTRAKDNTNVYGQGYW